MRFGSIAYGKMKLRQILFSAVLAASLICVGFAEPSHENDSLEVAEDELELKQVADLDATIDQNGLNNAVS